MKNVKFINTFKFGLIVLLITNVNISSNYLLAQEFVTVHKKQKLEVNKPVIINSLTYDTKENTKIILESVENYSLRTSKGSLIRLDYRFDKATNRYEDYIDLLFPENIILQNKTIIPVSYRLKYDVTRNHYKNAQLTDSGEGEGAKIELPYSYIGEAIISGENGATLKRSLINKNVITLIEGEAYLCEIEINRPLPLSTKTEKDTIPCKEIIYGMRGPLSQMIVLIGSPPFQKPDISAKIKIPTKGLIIRELSDSVGIAKQLHLEMDYNNVINVIKGSHVRIDYDKIKNEMFFDVFYTEKVILDPNTCIPLRFKIYTNPGQPCFAYSNFIATGKLGDFIFNFPPDYKGLVIISGENGAVLSRKIDDKRLMVIHGEAYYTLIE